jgi:hypothetical protein
MLDAIPARGDTAHAAKHRVEVAGRPEADLAGDLCDRQVRSSQKLAGAGGALPDHEAMRRIAGAAPEQAREVVTCSTSDAARSWSQFLSDQLLQPGRICV